MRSSPSLRARPADRWRFAPLVATIAGVERRKVTFETVGMTCTVKAGDLADQVNRGRAKRHRRRPADDVTIRSTRSTRGSHRPTPRRAISMSSGLTGTTPRERATATTRTSPGQPEGTTSMHAGSTALRNERLVAFAQLFCGRCGGMAVAPERGGPDVRHASMVGMPGMPGMPNDAMAAPDPWQPDALALTLVMWTVMMVGMMLPSAAPAIVLYGRWCVRDETKAHYCRRSGSSRQAIWPSGPGSVSALRSCNPRSSQPG